MSITNYHEYQIALEQLHNTSSVIDRSITKLLPLNKTTTIYELNTTMESLGYTNEHNVSLEGFIEHAFEQLKVYIGKMTRYNHSQYKEIRKSVSRSLTVLDKYVMDDGVVRIDKTIYRHLLSSEFKLRITTQYLISTILEVNKELDKLLNIYVHMDNYLKGLADTTPYRNKNVKGVSIGLSLDINTTVIYDHEYGGFEKVFLERTVGKESIIYSHHQNDWEELVTLINKTILRVDEIQSFKTNLFNDQLVTMDNLTVTKDYNTMVALYIETGILLKMDQFIQSLTSIKV